MKINQELQRFLDRNEYRSMLVELGNVGDWESMRKLMNSIFEFLYEYDQQDISKISRRLHTYKNKALVAAAIANSYGYLDRLITTSYSAPVRYNFLYIQSRLTGTLDQGRGIPC